MANFASLKATIDAQIKANGNQEITGPILNAVLTAMINTIGNGYALQGTVAQTTDNPGSPDNPVAYLAAGPGTYTNFGGVTVPDDGHAYLLTWDTSWTAVQLPIATYALVAGKQDQLTFDNTPTPGSTNPVTSDGIATALNGKIDKVPDALTNEIAVFDGDGGIQGSNKFLSDYATQADLADANARIDQIAGEAGLAEAVIDTDNAGTEQEFTFRKSGGDGGAFYRKPKGKTIVWNQLVKNGNFVNTSDWTTSLATLSTANNIASLSLTGLFGVMQQAVELTLNHKYLFSVEYKTASSTFILGIGQYNSSSARHQITTNGLDVWTRVCTVFDGSKLTGDKNIFVGNRDDATGSIEIRNFYITDLTFATLSDLTDAQFAALYPDLYYATNAGKLKNNDYAALESHGANWWDEEWEVGRYNPTTGEKVPGGSSFLCTKNYVPVFGNTTYYWKSPINDARLLYYDIEKNYISSDNTITNNTFTTPANCAFITFFWNISGGHDNICINISNAAFNGTYQPYWKRTLPLGLNALACHDENDNAVVVNGLDGVGTAYDEGVVENGMLTKIIKRFAEVDLGNLTWTYSANYFQFVSLSPQAAANTAAVGICSKYSVKPLSQLSVTNDKTIGIGSSMIYVRDTAYTDADIFGAAMAGVKLRYELATPVVLTLDNPVPVALKVDELGTEEAVQPEGATEPSAPFVADTTYTMSIARMVAILQGI